MLVHLLEIDFKHQLGCRFDILDSISSCFCILTYAILYILIHHIIFWLWFYFWNVLYFSSTPVFHRRSLCTFYWHGSILTVYKVFVLLKNLQTKSIWSRMQESELLCLPATSAKLMCTLVSTFPILMYYFIVFFSVSYIVAIPFLFVFFVLYICSCSYIALLSIVSRHAYEISAI